MMGRKGVGSSGLVVVLCMMLALFPVFGCGIKAPPRAPEKPGQAVAAPGDPTATITDSQLTLTWTHDRGQANAMLPPRYFEVYMAMPDDCEGCPFVFTSTGQVTMPEMTFQMQLNDNRSRYFRIQAVGDNDVRSDYSKTIFVEVP